MLPEFTNPFVYAHFSMRGGWKNTLVVAGAYGLILGGVIVATRQASTQPQTTMANWVIGLLVIQAFTLLLYGTGRLSGVVRADLKSGAMESHRLMPTPPSRVIGGYLVGGPVQALFIAGVTFLIGTLVCAAGSVEVSRFAVANFMLLVFSVTTWVVTLQLVLSTRAGASLIFISLFIGFSTNGVAAEVLPAVNVLTCPIIGRSIFSLKDSFSDLSFQYVTALAGQGLLAAVCFAAAVRKYRRPEEPAYNLWLGLALVAVLMALSAVGLKYIDIYTLPFMRAQPSTLLIGSTLLGMVAALVPISVTARRRSLWRKDPLATAEQKPAGSTIVAVALAVLLISAFLILGRNVRPIQFDYRFELSVIEVLATLSGVAAVMRWAYLVLNKAWFPVTIWLVLFWIVPLVADLVQRSIHDRADESMGPIASLSPIGMLITTWTGNPNDVRLGVLFAALVPLLPVALIIGRQRRLRARHAALEIPNAA